MSWSKYDTIFMTKGEKIVVCDRWLSQSLCRVLTSQGKPGKPGKSADFC